MVRPRIALTGASGFIGGAFAQAMAGRYELVGLSRSPPAADGESPLQWRRCDLYSLLDVERGLEGCEHAVYLVHSMMPSSRLTQASFSDLDLILADNFGRGAARAGVQHIVYVGGLLPQGRELSPHLESRREVEQALGAYGVRVTSLRAALVIGRGGSSFRILRRLVERLPVMLCPSWTRTPTQPVALDDVVELIAGCIDRPDLQGQVYDVGGPEVLTYRDMIAGMAELLGKKRRLIPVPMVSPTVSRLWVSTVTGTSRALVYPLVQSLRHEMIADDRRLQEALGIPGRPWQEAAREALTPASKPSQPQPKPLPLSASKRRRGLRQRRNVRSVQRLPRPPGASADQIAREYLRWLPSFFRPLLRVDVDGTVARFGLRPLRRPLLVLELSHERSHEGRAFFYVTGGLLAGKGDLPGRLEFRTTPDGRHVLAAIHEFSPALPWYLYLVSQALVHLWVMRGFGKHLGRVKAGSLPQSARES